MAWALRHLCILAIAAGLGAGAAQADQCKQRCDAEWAACMQQTKGDKAQCNARTTQCYQSCRKPR